MLVDTKIIDNKLVDDLRSGKVEEVLNRILPFISFLVDLIPKYCGG